MWALLDPLMTTFLTSRNLVSLRNSQALLLTLFLQVLTFDELQVLQSVVSDERLASNREDLLGYPVHSHSELILINMNTIEQDVVQRPIGLISQPIVISNVS